MLWTLFMLQFFNSVCYIIGGYEYSLQDIENGVLRANRRGVGMLSLPFSTHDPRLRVALDSCEPLVHFGLVCGAKSCPPIATYTADVSLLWLGVFTVELCMWYVETNCMSWMPVTIMNYNLDVKCMDSNYLSFPAKTVKKNYDVEMCRTIVSLRARF